MGSVPMSEAHLQLSVLRPPGHSRGERRVPMAEQEAGRMGESSPGFSSGEPVEIHVREHQVSLPTDRAERHQETRELVAVRWTTARPG